ncbi:hypothetical protein [Almyronema epifaneia]|uniref:Uncharacterized protein n=1 Tax=Almyronema epifaneia S1 TaxID=2991925 RepID=A0ABW6I9Y9_9CYAN
MRKAEFELFQLMVDAGAVPGRDFAFDEEKQAYWLSDRCYELLQTNYPAQDWQQTFSEAAPESAQPLVDEEVELKSAQQAIALLNQHLGVDFVERIIRYTCDRLKFLANEQAAWYLQQIVYGVEQRTGIPLYELLKAQLDLSTQARVEWLLREQQALTPCSEWMADLILAAGGSLQDFELIQGEEALLSERGIRLLAAVWMGDCDLYAEIARHQPQADEQPE